MAYMYLVLLSGLWVRYPKSLGKRMPSEGKGAKTYEYTDHRVGGVVKGVMEDPINERCMRF